MIDIPRVDLQTCINMCLSRLELLHGQSAIVICRRITTTLTKVILDRKTKTGFDRYITVVHYGCNEILARRQHSRLVRVMSCDTGKQTCLKSFPISESTDHRTCCT